jgi:hypothetical protein
MTIRRRSLRSATGWNRSNIALVAATLMLIFCVVSVTLQLSFHDSFRKHVPFTIQNDTTGRALLGRGPPPRRNHKNDHGINATLSNITVESQQTSLETNNDPAVEVATATAKPDYVSSLNVFYNIYIPADQGDDAMNKAINIVREQIGQVATAMGTSTPTQAKRETVVSYSTVGAAALNATWMDHLCSSSSSSDSIVSCRHMHHYESAQEEQTLQRVYDFCLVHPEETVAYIHTKGSFHNKAWNGLPQETWRRHGTAAAMSPECLAAVKDGQCNVCGLLFTVWPFVHTPGNFFSAHCSYISQLLPPMLFEVAMEDLNTKRLEMKEKGKLVMELFKEDDNTVGRGRYAAEHWVGSSPNIRPCDLSNTWNIQYWQRRNRPLTEFNFSMVPRHPANIHNKRIRTQENIRMREYFLLPGNIFKWLTLYHTVPPPASWVWSWFPDGEEWKTSFEKYGTSVLETVTWPYTLKESDPKEAVFSRIEKADALEGVPPLYSTVTRSLELAGSNKVEELDAESPPFAIFYNVYIPADESMKSVKKAFQIVEEQLDQVASSYAASLENKTVTIFYNTIGIPKAHIEIDRMCSEKDKVTCRHLRHYNQAHEDVTLQGVYDYCQTHETNRVVYMHSKGSFHSSSTQANWRRHMMMAVTSEMCLRPANDACSVCGMLLLPWPALHMVGNFFTADCSYVKKLVQPLDFGQRMADVTKKILLRKLQSRFVDGLLPEAPWHYGIDRWSSEHWIGSHPDVRPCDLSEEPRIEHWQDSPRKATEFSWAMAPRHSASARWSYVKQIPKQEDIRMREVYLLAGSLFKWSQLYNKTPDASSWIWDWYPDGQTWKESVTRYGAAKAVDMVTEQFSTK